MKLLVIFFSKHKINSPTFCANKKIEMQESITCLGDVGLANCIYRLSGPSCIFTGLTKVR